MAVTLLASGANAATDDIFMIKNPQSAFSITVDTDGITGSPTMTFYVGNTNDEDELKEYDVSTTDIDVNEVIFSLEILPFEFIAIGYTSNSSTGTFSIVISS